MLSKRVVALARSRGMIPRSTVGLLATSHYWCVSDETVKVPQMAESISEGTLKTWQKKVGDSVAADEEVATIETDKIDVSVNAPAAGRITELLVNEEDTVTVGQDLFRFAPGGAGESSASAAETAQPDAAEPKAVPKQEQPLPPPVQGSTKAEAKETSKPTPAPKDQGKQRHTLCPACCWRRMRLRIAERLKESQNTAAFLTTFNEIDMSSLMEMRKRYKDEVLKQHEVKLGFMSAFARACTLALKEIPAANASIEGDEIVYRDYVDLSVAVATPKGLVTPVIRNVESLSFVEFERELSALGKKARDNKLTLEDMAGGSFTISNGGVFGSLYGTPIINLPQSAVLGMHATKDRPVVVDGQIVIRPIMIVALTYDHRLLDGREAVTFLVRVKEYIEDPRKMLLA
ncbi:dihydrolipoamide succinyltransferase [Russula earlei]|uniref:Dihydrolipoamide succinyltransferase n=1 Tax=Russula earlei TaxID=71964 RepID=A0ACC0UC66_9AGAM|nr:dihydrolipoamide succinyltransferase [Russula earlei]